MPHSIIWVFKTLVLLLLILGCIFACTAKIGWLIFVLGGVTLTLFALADLVEDNLNLMKRVRELEEQLGLIQK